MVDVDGVVKAFSLSSYWRISFISMHQICYQNKRKSS